MGWTNDPKYINKLYPSTSFILIGGIANFDYVERKTLH